MTNEIEKEIIDKGLTAPRVTPADIEAVIDNEYYFTARQGVDGCGDMSQLVSAEIDHQNLSLLTFCVLVLKNGFTVTGESACASPENFDAALGKKIAKANAVNKIWPLLGYELKSQLNRRIFYVDVGDMSATDVKKHVQDMKEIMDEDFLDK